MKIRKRLKQITSEFIRNEKYFHRVGITSSYKEYRDNVKYIKQSYKEIKKIFKKMYKHSKKERKQ